MDGLGLGLRFGWIDWVRRRFGYLVIWIGQVLFLFDDRNV